ncbi:MAG: hypothetical protein HXY24_15575, partial [Rubrivivax sp.]|nr:hypothetical protein [Rubrivivax sp.]
GRFGFERAYLPGGIEVERELLWCREGIPVGPEHRQRLQELAEELGPVAPW